MSKKELVAITQIHLGTPKRDGTVKQIAPGEVFTCSPEDREYLLKEKAAKEAPEARKTVHVDDDEDDAGGGADTRSGGEDPAETQRLALLEKAKAAGVKGLRSNSTVETIEAKMAEHEKAKADGTGPDDGDVLG